MRFIEIPFDDVPPRVLVVSCCDGRFIDAVEELLYDLGTPLHDLLAYPGGPAQLAGELRDQDPAVANALRFMKNAHGTELVVLVAHEDCGFYKHRFGVSDPEHQRQDLRLAAREVRDRYSVATACYYLTRRPGGVGADIVPFE